MLTGDQICGVLLAGGQSRRMGGGDKCLREIGGRTLLDRIIEIVGPQVRAMVLNANGDPARFARFSLPIAADTVTGFAGPLAGVLAGMDWARANAGPCSHIATVPTDAPLLPTNLVSRLAASGDGKSERIVLAKSDDRLHPVIGLWPVCLADDLRAQLEAGVRKVLDWTARHDVASVEFAPVEIAGRAIDPFFNANRPDDLQLAERLIGEGERGSARA